MVRFERHKYFTKEFMEENFGVEHIKAFGCEIQAGGYPDTCEGRIAKKLPYKEWVEINKSVRCHQNYKEWYLTTLVIVMITGIFAPLIAALTNIAVIIGRFFYTFGYKISPEYRIAGAILHEIPVGLCLLYTLFSAGRIIIGF